MRVRKITKKKWVDTELFPYILLLVLVLVFALADRDFLSIDNIVDILLNNTYVIVFCVGYAFILTCGGIDLSAGMQISLVSVVTSVLSYEHVPAFLVLLAAITVGLAAGGLNALLVAKMRIPYSMATLSSMILFYAISSLVSGGKSYWVSPESVRKIFIGSYLGVPGDLWILIFSLAVLTVVFKYSHIGNHMIAVGENPTASSRIGVNVEFVRAASLVVGSLFFALTALMFISQKGVSKATDGVDFFQITGFPAAYMAVAAAGKQGRIRKCSYLALRFTVGASVLIVLNNGITLLNLGIELEYLFTGIVLVLAMSQGYKKSFNGRGVESLSNVL